MATDPTPVCMTVPAMSLNQAYRAPTIRGRPRVLLSKKAREYSKKIEGIVLQRNLYRRWECPIRVAIRLTEPDTKRRDLDNLNKVLLDALKKAGVFKDDSQIDYLELSRQPINPLLKSAEVLVVVQPMNTLECY